MKPSALRAAVAALAVVFAFAADAADTLKVAYVGGSTAWDFSVVGFGERLGFFAEKGIKVEMAVTDNTASGLQAVIAGSVDVANVGVTAFIGAALKGAPIKMISSEFRGTSDWLWYVRVDSPIKSFADVTEKTTIAVNSLGASQFIVLRTLLDQYGVKANVVAVGTTAAGMTAVMSGQVDIGTDGNGLLGSPQLQKGEVRPVAYGRDASVMHDVTVRGLAVRADLLRDRRDVIVRFLQAYQKTVEWMYRDPKAVEWFAEAAESTVDEARRVRTDMYPAGAMNVGGISGIDVSVKQGLDFKRIDRAPTADELDHMFEAVWTPAM